MWMLMPLVCVTMISKRWSGPSGLLLLEKADGKQERDGSLEGK